MMLINLSRIFFVFLISSFSGLNIGLDTGGSMFSSGRSQDHLELK